MSSTTPSSQTSSSQAARETATVNVISERDARRASVGALVGNVLEWYDFFLFNTAAALVFNVQFFVSDNAAVAAMASFATLAIGFIVRPLGGLIFGRLGDRIGRKAVLMITVVGIGVATGIIGFLPNYVSIGIWAPLFLIVLRCAQGFFIGGEWSGAMTLAVENAPLHMRARMAALPQLGSPIATLLSSGGFFLLTFYMSKDTFDAWGWRIPFVAAIPLLLLAVWLRAQMHESPVFKNLEKSGEREKSPLKTMFVTSWRQLLVAVSAAMLGTAGFYIVTTFVLNYSTRVLGIESSIILMATLIGAICQLFVVVHAGRLGQKYGPTRVIFWAGVVALVAAFPFFLLVQTGQPVLIVIGVIVGLALSTYSFAAVGPVITGLFPSSVRLSGVAVGFNGANVLSGLTPLVATALVTAAGDAWWPAALLLMLFAGMSVVGAMLTPRLSQQYEGYKH